MSTQTKNLKHSELLAQLKAQAKTKSKSEIAQATQTQEVAQTQIKTREVKDFIVKKTSAELDTDSRQVVKERRAYMMSALDSNTSEVYNATCYRNDKNELVLFSQKLANKFTNEFVAKLASSQKFDAQDIMSLLKTCGGAYGDKVRNALYAISMRTTALEIEKDVDAVIAQAKAKNKLCIFYNVIEDSRRAKYDEIQKCEHKKKCLSEM
jgi:hypothetical protein